MEQTQYFIHTRFRPDRISITDEMIESVISHPIAKEVQSDSRIRLWGKAQGKYLRIILLDDGVTVHNAFFDRNFKED